MDADGTFVEWDPGSPGSPGIIPGSSGTRVFFVLAPSERQAKTVLTRKKRSAPGELTWTIVDEDGSSLAPVSPSIPSIPSIPLAPVPSTLAPLTPVPSLASPVIILKEMGVLGLSNGEKGRVDIPPNHIVVDPAGLPYISGTLQIRDAGGLSGAIYAHYRVKLPFRPGSPLRDCAGFPYAVKKNVSAEGAAFAYQYHEGTVIHVVGPNFATSGTIDMEDAVNRLSTAYYNVIKAAESHVRDVQKANERNAYKNGAVVRMPLISMGEFAGKLTDEQKYKLTAKAVTRAFSAVKTPKSKNGPDIQYWLCLYHNKNSREYKGYQREFARIPEKKSV